MFLFTSSDRTKQLIEARKQAEIQMNAQAFGGGFMNSQRFGRVSVTNSSNVAPTHPRTLLLSTNKTTSNAALATPPSSFRVLPMVTIGFPLFREAIRKKRTLVIQTSFNKEEEQEMRKRQRVPDAPKHYKKESLPIEEDDEEEQPVENHEELVELDLNKSVELSNNQEEETETINELKVCLEEDKFDILRDQEETETSNQLKVCLEEDKFDILRDQEETETSNELKVRLEEEKQETCHDQIQSLVDSTTDTKDDESTTNLILHVSSFVEKVPDRSDFKEETISKQLQQIKTPDLPLPDQSEPKKKKPRSSKKKVTAGEE